MFVADSLVPAISYGGSGNWGFVSRYHTPQFSLALTSFNVLNQTFFMGTFFLLSGHFSLLAARSRTRYAFLKGKIRHLRIPTLVYTIIGPVLDRLMMEPSIILSPLDVWRISSTHLASLRELKGPVWYCAVLLLFVFIYAALRPGEFDLEGQKKRNEDEEHMALARSAPVQAPNQVGVLGYLGIVSVASFFIRLYYPCGRQLRLLNLTPCYLPQYVAAYATGIAFAPLDPSALINAKARTWLLLISVATTVSCISFIKYSSLLTDNGYDPRSGPMIAVLGGWNPLAAFYALWNESVGTLVFSALLSIFRQYGDRQVSTLPRYAYVAFLVHKQTVMFWQYALDWWGGSGVNKTAVVGAIGFVASFCNGWVLVAALEMVDLKGFV